MRTPRFPDVHLSETIVGTFFPKMNTIIAIARITKLKIIKIIETRFLENLLLHRERRIHKINNTTITARATMSHKRIFLKLVSLKIFQYLPRRYAIRDPTAPIRMQHEIKNVVALQQSPILNQKTEF